MRSFPGLTAHTHSRTVTRGQSFILRARRVWKPWFVALVLGLLGGGSAPVLAQEPTVVVRLTLDSDAALASAVRPRDFAQWATEKSLFRVVPRDNERSIEALLNRTITKTQRAARDAVLLLNDVRPRDPLGSPGAPEAILVPPGSAPVLPQASAAQTGPQLVSLNRVNKDTPEFEAILASLPSAARTAAEARAPAVFTYSGKSAVLPRRTVQLELTKEEFRSLEAQFPSMKVQHVSGGLTVRLEGGAAATKPLDAATLQFFEKSVAPRARPSELPLVIVVDDSWPSKAAFTRSREILSKSIAGLWRLTSVLAQGSGRGHLLPEGLISVKDPGVPKGYGCKDWAGCNTHARRIELAIEPYVEAAGKPLVDVMYVPLTASQDGARDYLKSLWELAYAYNPSDLLVYAEAATPRSLAIRDELGARFLGAIPEELKGDDISFSTNRGILTSVFTFARLYSLSKKVPVFISVSWTTADVDFKPPPVSGMDSQVMPVGAAGNHCLRDTCDQYSDQEPTPRQFTRTAVNSQEFLVVMNLDDTGKPTCQSSRVRTSAFVVAFDGALIGDCGTSFSTPRVAWLLAAKEALSPTQPSEGRTWQKTLADSLVSRAVKCKSQSDFACLRIAYQPLLGRQ